MIDQILFLSICIALIVLAFQDFKSLSIGLQPLVVLFVFSLVLALRQSNALSILQSSFACMLFLLMQFVVLELYFRFKHGQFFGLDKMIGVGDLLFYLAVIPIMNFSNYLLYFCVSIIAALVIGVFVKWFYKHKNPKIPLAGTAAIVLLFSLIISKLCKYSLYEINIFC